MKLIFSEAAWEDYQYWRMEEPAVFDRLNELLGQCRRTPFKGTGKPEPLRGDLAGWWSRRVTLADRLVYRVRGAGAEQVLEVAQCRFHY